MRSWRVPKLTQGLVAAPAMVMALGIFLLFAARFLLNLVLADSEVDKTLYGLGWLLAIWAAYLLLLFIDQLIRDRRVLWDYTISHFSIGTWVAGANVLSAVIQPLSPDVARAANGAGWLLWIVYMVWLLGMVRRTEQRSRINGTAFLTTVATQSVVISTLTVWAEVPAGVVYALVGLNLLGIIMYCIHFYMILFAVGVKEQFRNWVPQNNITHGAVSISILAAAIIAANVPSGRHYLQRAIEAVWAADGLLFLLILLVELFLLLSGKRQLLKFKMANYSRNFTYGMFFACTYFSATQLSVPLIEAATTDRLLIGLAGLVVLVNVWEVSHHVATGMRRRGAQTAAATAPFVVPPSGGKGRLKPELRTGQPQSAAAKAKET